MKKSFSDNNQFWIEFGVDLSSRKIVVDEDIDEYTVGWAIRGLIKMEEISDKPIDIYVNSYGGSVYDGLALYDMMVGSKCLIRTHAIGKIMSMGLIIYLAGDERYSSDYSSFMNHGMSSIAIGKLYELETEYKECQRLEEICNEILSERTNKSKKYWKKTTKYEDNYYGKRQAIELGIVTHEY